jgi:hypothetical protein
VETGCRGGRSSLRAVALKKKKELTYMRVSPLSSSVHRCLAMNVSLIHLTYLCFNIVACWLKARIAKPEETVVLGNGSVAIAWLLSKRKKIRWRFLRGPCQGCITRKGRQAKQSRGTLETAGRKVGVRCEMAASLGARGRKQRNVHCWKTLQSNAVKTVTENTIFS